MRSIGCIVPALIVAVAGSTASAQLLQFGSGNGSLSFGSQGVLYMSPGPIVNNGHFAVLDFTLYGTIGQTYNLTFGSSPAGGTVGFDYLGLSGGQMGQGSDPISFTFTPDEQRMNFRVLVENYGVYQQGGVFSQISFRNVTTGAAADTFTNVPLVLNPYATEQVSANSSTYGMPINLISGGSLNGGNGGAVNGAVTTAPGSTVNVSGGTLTLGDGQSQVQLNGNVNVPAGSTLSLNSSGRAVLGGVTEVNHGTVSSASGIQIGGGLSAGASADLQSLLNTLAVERAAVTEASLAGQVQTMLNTQSQILAFNQQLSALRALPASPERDQQIQAVQGQLDAVASSQQLDMLRLQALVERRDQAFELTTSLISQFNGLRSSILANMRSTFDGDLVVTTATLNIAPGEMGHTDVLGDFTLSAGALLGMETDGAGAFDTVMVTGDAVFEPASMLRLDLLTGDPSLTLGFLETFDLLTASSITVDGLVVVTNDPSGMLLFPDVIDNADGTQTLRITAVPTPGAAGLLALAAAGAARRRGRERSAN